MSLTRSAETYVVTLGTCGGPRWRTERAGISTAVVVGDAVYVIDFGYGAGVQLVKAGLDISRLRAGFVTHLHSDHISDLANLLLYGWFHGLPDVTSPVTLLGPGSRMTVPPAAAGMAEPAIVCPNDPEPGFSATVAHLMQAYATDINDRMRDGARPHPDELLRVKDIELPPGIGFDPDLLADAPMEPLAVYEDENVAVSAILVAHAPMSPAFAFRLDTAQGSVVVSGDTGPCDNLVKLATGADVLVHEVIDEKWAEAGYADRPAHERAAMVQHHLSAHTSIPAVGQLAQAAGVGTLVLTHFVPGNLMPGRWHEAADHFDGELIVANDLDRIPLDRAHRA